MLHLSAPREGTGFSVGEQAGTVANVKHEVFCAVAHIAMFGGMMSVQQRGHVIDAYCKVRYSKF